MELAVDGDVELAGLADLELDVLSAELFEAIPHPEGLRLVASSAAIFDQDFHAAKVGAYARASKGESSMKYGPLGRSGLIVSRIVQEHRGSLREEDNPPRGAGFAIELPA